MQSDALEFVSYYSPLSLHVSHSDLFILSPTILPVLWLRAFVPTVPSDQVSSWCPRLAPYYLQVKHDFKCDFLSDTSPRDLVVEIWTISSSTFSIPFSPLKSKFLEIGTLVCSVHCGLPSAKRVFGQSRL